MMRDHWTDPDLRLVLTGGAGLAEHVVAAAHRPPGAAVSGACPAADRNGLLAMAEAMVFPSQYEGFGAPLIEAMTLGAPVVCSDATCMPQIVGDAGLVLPLRTRRVGRRARRSAPAPRRARGRGPPSGARLHVARQRCGARRGVRASVAV